VSERSGLNPTRAIALVARREFLTQVQKKSFLVSNVIVLIAIIGGIVAASIFSGKDDDSRSEVGLVGDQSLSAVLVSTGEAVGNPVEVTEIGDEQTARTQVENGDLDVAVVPGSGGAVTAITKSEIDTSLRVVLDGAVAAQAQSAALAARNVDAAQLAESRWNLGALYLLPEVTTDRFAEFRSLRIELMALYTEFALEAIAVIGDPDVGPEAASLPFRLVEATINARSDAAVDRSDAPAQAPAPDLVADSVLRVLGRSGPATEVRAVARAELDRLTGSCPQPWR